MKEVKAPNPYNTSEHHGVLFLAGSIEMGEAENWQQKVVESVKEADLLVLNPRRDDWDNNWKQDIDNDEFRKQVEWELKGIEDADIVVVNFCAGTKSPITLLELGLLAEKGSRVVVICPEGYWRRGNVEIVCKRYGMNFLNSLEEYFIMVGKVKAEALGTE